MNWQLELTNLTLCPKEEEKFIFIFLEYCFEVAHNSTTGELSNYFHFTKHENEYMKKPSTHFLKSGMRYKCSPKNDYHMFPGYKITVGNQLHIVSTQRNKLRQILKSNIA